jgi:short-subunit dehydrogenase
VYDFSTTTSHHSIDVIVNQVKNLDISMLINNVGMTTTPMHENFTDISENDMQNVFTVNCTA